MPIMEDDHGALRDTEASEGAVPVQVVGFVAARDVFKQRNRAVAKPEAPNSQASSDADRVQPRPSARLITDALPRSPRSLQRVLIRILDVTRVGEEAGRQTDEPATSRSRYATASGEGAERSGSPAAATTTIMSFKSARERLRLTRGSSSALESAQENWAARICVEVHLWMLAWAWVTALDSVSHADPATANRRHPTVVSSTQSHGLDAVWRNVQSGIRARAGSRHQLPIEPLWREVHHQSRGIRPRNRLLLRRLVGPAGEVGRAWTRWRRPRGSLLVADTTGSSDRLMRTCGGATTRMHQP